MFLMDFAELKEKAMEIIQKISDFGNKIYDYSIGWISSLSGLAKGWVAIGVVFLMIVGALTLFKKSFKLVGIIFIIAIAVVAVLAVLGKLGNIA